MPHPLFFRENPDDDQAYKEKKYEEKLVSHLMAMYGLAGHKSKLRQECRRRFGDTNLRLSVFVDFFGSFPVNMSVCRIPGTVKNCALDKLFNKITSRKVTEKYMTLLDELEDPQQRPLALVFPWTFIPKGMVLHNRQVPVDQSLTGLKKPVVRLIWTLPEKKQKKHGNYLVMENHHDGHH
jgi:hypothetical protein